MIQWSVHVQRVPQVSSFLHSSFLQVISMIQWSVHVQRVPQVSSFLHSSFLQVISMIQWSVHVQRVPQVSSFLHSSFLQVISMIQWSVHVQRVPQVSSFLHSCPSGHQCYALVGLSMCRNFPKSLSAPVLLCCRPDCLLCCRPDCLLSNRPDYACYAASLSSVHLRVATRRLVQAEPSPKHTWPVASGSATE